MQARFMIVLAMVSAALASPVYKLTQADGQLKSWNTPKTSTLEERATASWYNPSDPGACWEEKTNLS
jgi:hypothetical protein